ncbi:MAG: hypothetical protein JKY65_19065 [Planctomycetes bacterium]|nr:hypothetical protein [Planctomycetota bacterium]
MVATVDSIRLECSCGKKARVPARYAGRRVRCSQCKDQLRVPGSGSSVKPSAAQRAPAPAARVASPRRLAPTRRPQAQPRQTGWEGNEPLTLKPLDPYAPPRARIEPTRPSRKKRQSLVNRDLAAERHIQAIGVWQRISAVLALVGCGLFLLLGVGGALAGGGQAVVSGGIGLVGFLICAVIGAFYWCLGRGLMAYKGWPRVVIGVFTVLGLLGSVAGAFLEPTLGGLISNGISAAWEMAILWALYGPRASRVFQPEYRLDNLRVEWWVSPFFWLPWVLMVLVFALVFVGIAAA